MNVDQTEPRTAIVPFVDRLLSHLSLIHILPRRMLLETRGVAATVPMLRGVWGAALHDLDPRVYACVFGPNDAAGREDAAAGPARSAPLHRAGTALARMRPGSTAPHRPAPVHAAGTAVAQYILRPAPADPEFAPAVEWILVGEALQHDFTLCRAWDVASGMGLGPQRLRFHLRRSVALHPDGESVEHTGPWPLSDARWMSCSGDGTPLATNGFPSAGLREIAPDQHCRVMFPAPLRLMFRKRLIEAPTLPDIVVAACRRAKAYLPADQFAAWDELSREALELARDTPADAWRGERLDLHRYSARQESELDLHGVTGTLDLPAGPGQLWPLLAAAQWLHLGKGTVMGLGQLRVAG